MTIFDDAASGNLNTIKLNSYLTSGTQIDAVDAGKRTALWHAVHEAQTDVVKLLLDNGAKPNHPALYEAAGISDSIAGPAIVQLLIEKGPEIDAFTNFGITPLMRAIDTTGNIDVIKALLKAGASKTRTNKVGENAIAIAERVNVQEILNALNGLADTEQQSNPMVSGNPEMSLTEICLNEQSYYLQDNKAIARFYPGWDDKTKDVLGAYSKQAANLAHYILTLQHRPDSSPGEIAPLTAILSLYDLVLLLDDSPSMKREQNGARVQTLGNVLRLIAQVFSLGADAGRGILAIRWLNATGGLDNATPDQIDRLLEKHRYAGLTAIGNKLVSKVLKPFFYDRKLHRPLLVMVITDGEVEGESDGHLEQVLKDCAARAEKEPDVDETSNLPISIQFSRIGNDRGAQALLERLANVEHIKRFVDTQPVAQNLDEAVGRGDQEAILSLVRLLVGGMMPEVRR